MLVGCRDDGIKGMKGPNKRGTKKTAFVAFSGFCIAKASFDIVSLNMLPKPSIL